MNRMMNLTDDELLNVYIRHYRLYPDYYARAVRRLKQERKRAATIAARNKRENTTR